MTYKKKPDETEKAYIYRICSMKDEIGTWHDVADILNCELDHQWTESAYRKKYQAGQDYLIENQSIIYDDEAYLQQLREERENVKRERYKLQTEKLEYNRWLREHARDELFEEHVIESIEQHLGNANIPSPIPVINKERCGILMLSDMHFGTDFCIRGPNNEIINQYNPEVFYERMERLLGQVIEYVKHENLSYLKVFNLGDSLDGFIHQNQLRTLRWGVVDSAIIFSDYMGKWFNQLSSYVNIEYYAVKDSNHTELRLLDGLKGSHQNENIEKVTNHIIALINKNNPNFRLIDNDSGMIFVNVVGYNILGIHGEVKDKIDAMKDYSMAYDVKIDYMAAGHLHHSNYNNCGIRKGVIGVGSIMGSNEYSMKLRKAADATASLIIFEKDKGKTDEHTFVLN